MMLTGQAAPYFHNGIMLASEEDAVDFQVTVTRLANVTNDIFSLELKRLEF